MKSLITCIVALFLMSLSVMADDKKGREQKQHAVTDFFSPEPDKLPEACLPDRHVAPVAEYRLSVVHTVSKTYGIDVSHYQGTINWEAVAKDENAQFAYLKCTESTGLLDSHYRHNLAEAKRVGIPVGVYHFFSPSTSAMMQLQNFLSNVDPRQQDLIPIVDVEKRGKSSLDNFQSQLRIFCEEVERVYGVQPIIYTGINFFNKYLAGKFSKYKFMIARYGEDVPVLMEEVPIVLWQFTQEGSINGIRGNVDRSCFLDNYSLKDILLPQKRRTNGGS